MKFEAMPSSPEERPEAPDDNRLVEIFLRRIGAENQEPENIERAISALEIARKSVEELPGGMRAFYEVLNKLAEIVTIAGHKGTELVLRAGLEVLPDSERLKAMRESVSGSRAL